MGCEVKLLFCGLVGAEGVGCESKLLCCVERGGRRG
jgi:hypothetical protein